MTARTGIGARRGNSKFKKDCSNGKGNGRTEKSGKEKSKSGSRFLLDSVGLICLRLSFRYFMRFLVTFCVFFFCCNFLLVLTIRSSRLLEHNFDLDLNSFISLSLSLKICRESE